MKRIASLLLTLTMLFALTACGESGGKSTGSGPQTVSDVMQQQMTVQTPQPASTPEAAAVQTVSAGDVDIDLTALSSTAVYAEVYNMLTAPDDYIDKTVRMRGAFSMFHDESTDAYYFACIIADATACCSQGIEFVLTGERSYPDDYPELGTEITVEGTFSTYMEGEYMYVTLLDAEFVE